MGIVLFSFVWLSILSLVRQRLNHMKSPRIKKARRYLQLASTTYFVVWLGYPCLWVLEEAGILGPVVSHVVYVILDILAKSVYAFALLLFLLSGEKMDIIFVPLRPSLEKTGLNNYDADKDNEFNFGDDQSGCQPTIIGSKRTVDKLKAEAYSGSLLGAADSKSITNSRENKRGLSLTAARVRDSFRAQMDLTAIASTDARNFPTMLAKDYDDMDDFYHPQAAPYIQGAAYNLTADGDQNERFGLETKLSDTEKQIELLNETLKELMTEQQFDNTRRI
mmetsp:Transcript_48371/g.77934  ORF Transcript_48371/g.77934 Transcript_48371/m.77934 type:complete len:278 (-) Transcript_48371:68-901(-)|eukprot:CAMPEP_0179442774 /NCGR_PEP_ID=MMETSP0799-20121207/26267_1 /TAXON_ID=46947 /ORGANISM="Geminigera cryophila, Strain CCMP2564" /LENGTH=277 /DNA_ID=CAMNT_0021228247 /DNA_START=380 /DNA_END=1213 /DNA_ORIENTATION=-